MGGGESIFNYWNAKSRHIFTLYSRNRKPRHRSLTALLDCHLPGRHFLMCSNCARTLRVANKRWRSFHSRPSLANIVFPCAPLSPSKDWPTFARKKPRNLDGKIFAIHSGCFAYKVTSTYHKYSFRHYIVWFSLAICGGRRNTWPAMARSAIARTCRSH